MKIVDIINKLPSLRHLAPATDEDRLSAAFGEGEIDSAS